MGTMKTYQTRFTLACAFLLLGKEIVGQSCYTPNGQQGHCVPLNECPKVFDIFANPPRGSETYLRQFLCTEAEQLKVCCGTAANFTVLEDDPPSSGFFDIFDRIAFKNCFQGSLSNIDLAMIVRGSKDSNVEDKRCLGILVNPRYVITPAQCVVVNTKGQQFTLVRVQFRGKNNDSPTFGIEEVISHPFFDPVTGTNDIALLRLNQTVSEGNVPVLCNGEPYTGYISSEEETMFTYSNLALSTIERGLNKNTVSITSLSREECEEDFQQKGAHVVLTKHDVCLKNVKNVTKFTCNEFTGVPLFLKYFGLGYFGFSSSRTVCKDGLPVIYTNLNAYSGWLKGQMRPWPINNDPCTTPNGEIGECWYLSHCPALLDAFSSVTNATEAYLRGFICEAGEEFPVCCVTSSNSTIVVKTEEPKLDDLPIQFLETRLCGMQHRDDYFSSSAAIAIDEFPWIALIETGPPFHSCAGALINSRYVISTAICVGYMNMDTATVRLGDYYKLKEMSCVKDPDIDATDCTETEKFGVEDIIPHPFYTWNLNNIGLLRLSKTVTYTDFIRPICLPIPGTVTPKVGDTMYVSSWGYQSDQSKQGIKKKVLTQLIHKEQCHRQFSAYSNIKHRNIICTLDYQNNTDFSDRFGKGGPLMFDNNYRWYIAGLLWVPTDHLHFPNFYIYIAPTDQRHVPKFYVNVLKYINWIIYSMKPW